MKQSNVVRIVVGKEIEAKLMTLGKAYVDCWNEVNMFRLELYKKHEFVDFEKTKQLVFEKFKDVLGENVREVALKNMEAWMSFFALRKKKKEGELPEWMNPKPPHKKKDDLFLLIRHDRLVEGNKIVLLDFGLRLRFVGKLEKDGKQGPLEIFYDNAEKKWYAKILF